MSDMATCCQCDKKAVTVGPGGPFCLDHEEQFQRTIAYRQQTTGGRINDLLAMAERRVGLPPGTLAPQPAPVVHQTGPVTTINVGDNRGVINTGTARNITVQWGSPESEAALGVLTERVKNLAIGVEERNEVLRLLAALKDAKHPDERLGVATQIERFVKLVPARVVTHFGSTAVGPPPLAPT